jgi:probable blue pigment (indigoidine) exporter
VSRAGDVALTSLGPMVWGTTYIVTTEFLPQGYALHTAMLRALPAGLLLLLVVRKLPWGAWWWRVAVLGALNFSIFFTLLFISAYRLPGGVAATVGAAQPLVVVFLAPLLLATPLSRIGIAAAITGVIGVGLTVLTPAAALDPLGILAGIAGATAMAFGVVLSRRWQPPVGALTFTAWQMTAGGLLLLPVALLAEPPLPAPNLPEVLGFAWLGLVGGAAAYLLWFRGIARLGPQAASPIALLSPVTATVIGWAVLGQALSPAQTLGIVLVLASVWAAQRRASPNAAAASHPAKSASATDIRP